MQINSKDWEKNYARNVTMKYARKYERNCKELQKIVGIKVAKYKTKKYTKTIKEPLKEEWNTCCREQGE